ncbi:hypothetical protein TSOC_009571, partial [Tetrabaena socialis]
IARGPDRRDAHSTLSCFRRHSVISSWSAATPPPLSAATAAATLSAELVQQLGCDQRPHHVAGQRAADLVQPAVRHHALAGQRGQGRAAGETGRGRVADASERGGRRGGGQQQQVARVGAEAQQQLQGGACMRRVRRRQQHGRLLRQLLQAPLHGRIAQRARRHQPPRLRIEWVEARRRTPAHPHPYPASTTASSETQPSARLVRARAPTVSSGTDARSAEASELDSASSSSQASPGLSEGTDQLLDPLERRPRGGVLLLLMMMMGMRRVVRRCQHVRPQQQRVRLPHRLEWQRRGKGGLLVRRQLQTQVRGGRHSRSATAGPTTMYLARTNPAYPAQDSPVPSMAAST